MRWLDAFQPRLGALRQYPPRPLCWPRSTTPATTSCPTISLVTPAFNQGLFLERTLRSVLDQEYPALEYRVQDGGSTDETRAILQRHTVRLTHWESVADGGQAQAINWGLNRSSGEILGWLNSDDLLAPGTLLQVGQFFAAHPEVDVVYGHRLLIDENDGEIGRWLLPPHEDAALLWRDYIPQETLFWRRWLWEHVGGLDENLHFALDWDLLLRFRRAGARFARIPHFLGAFRVHPQQKTANLIQSRGQEECRWLLQREHGRAVPEEEIQQRTRRYLLRHVVLDRLHWLRETALGLGRATVASPGCGW